MPLDLPHNDQDHFKASTVAPHDPLGPSAMGAVGQPKRQAV